MKLNERTNERMSARLIELYLLIACICMCINIGEWAWLYVICVNDGEFSGPLADSLNVIVVVVDVSL